MELRERLMTTDEFYEFVDRPENALKSFELLDGVLYEMPSASAIHGIIASHFIGLLAIWQHTIKQTLGYPVGDNNDFELAPGTVLQPDAAFVSKGRSSNVRKRFKIAPDVAVEVVSPSNTPLDILTKVETYIRYGTLMVIVMYIDEKAVRVYTPNADGSLTLRKLTADDTLDGGAVLPGFSVRVGDLFPDVDVDERE